MSIRTAINAGLVVLLILALPSCVLFGKHGNKHKDAVAATASEQPAEQNYEAQLKAVVSKQIESIQRTSDEQRTRVLRKKPYFYRQYEAYPSGADDTKIVIQEKETRSAPYIADVTVEKQRFITRYHRKRGEAEQDASFLRETGTETITFEFRNSHWVRVGSLFVAAKTEENVNGEWVPFKETSQRTVAAEEEKSKGGWFKRTFRKILGTGDEEKDAEKDAKDKKGAPAGSQKLIRTQKY